MAESVNDSGTQAYSGGKMSEKIEITCASCGITIGFFEEPEEGFEAFIFCEDCEEVNE